MKQQYFSQDSSDCNELYNNRVNKWTRIDEYHRERKRV